MTSVFLTSLPSLQAEVAAKHQASMDASLASRLEKARVASNDQLIALLNQEQLQLAQGVAVQQPSGSLGQLVRSVWQRAVAAIVQPALPVVEPVATPQGVVWRAYDPTTGETRWAETEGEVIDWLEANRQQPSLQISGYQIPGRSKMLEIWSGI
jgi:hypothetical protein